MNEATKMILVLMLIAMISGVSLSLVNDLTAGIIRDNLAKELHGSIFQVLPAAVDVKVIEANPSFFFADDESSLRNIAAADDEPIFLYQGLNEQNKPVGFAYVSEATGYGGIIKVMIGVDHESEEIVGVTILDHVESPGIGSRIEEDTFRNQFLGVVVTDPITIGQDIQNISGATVSAKAVTKAIRQDLEAAIMAYREAN